MAEYIEREKLVKALKIWQDNLIETYGKNDEYVKCLDSVLLGIDSAPAADVRPVARGFNKLKDYPSLFECSACGWECSDTMPGDTITYNFCPNCGAEMEES